MKNFFISALAIFALASCEKEDAKNPSESDKPVAARQTGSLRVYYDNGGTDYGCKGSGGNCLPDVIVTAPKHFAYLSLFEPEANVPEIFRGNIDLFAQDIDINLINGVIEGAYTVNTRSNRATNLKYLYFNRGEETSAVYPLLFN